MDPDRIWRYVYLASACLLFAWLLFRWFVALREEFRGYGRAEAKRVTEDIRRAELAERVAGDIVRAEPAPGDPDAGRPAQTEDEL